MELQFDKRMFITMFCNTLVLAICVYNIGIETNIVQCFGQWDVFIGLDDIFIQPVPVWSNIFSPEMNTEYT